MSIQKRKYKKHKKGDRTGTLTLIERMPGGQKWRCKCDCGAEVVTQVTGGAKRCMECAYLKNSQDRIVHGESPDTNKGATRLYRIWTGMRNRCNNQNNHNFNEYGGRGVNVCREWDSYLNFKEWALDSGYEDNLSIDRIDNDGDYKPSNCKWSTQMQQMKNTRRNHNIEIDGVELCVMDWCNGLNIRKSTAYCTAKERGITVDEYIKEKYDDKHDLGMTDPQLAQWCEDKMRQDAKDSAEKVCDTDWEG